MNLNTLYSASCKIFQSEWISILKKADVSFDRLLWIKRNENGTPTFEYSNLSKYRYSIFYSKRYKMAAPMFVIDKPKNKGFEFSDAVDSNLQVHVYEWS